MNHPVYVHIGLPKTGTTYLQGRLWRARGALAQQGILYPGERTDQHWLATLDLHGQGYLGRHLDGVDGAWKRLLAEIRDWPGPVVISHELLAGTAADKIDQLLADLAPRDVHVVLTLRDLSRVVPATWQERAKNGQIERWDDFLAAVADGPEGGHSFWNLQDAAGIARRWGARVPGERVHVVTVPPPAADRDLLLRRFAEVVGADPEALSVDAPRQPNESIGAVEVAVVQRINGLLPERLDWDDYHRLVKHFVVPRMLATRADQQRFFLPESGRQWVETELRRTEAAVAELGCTVVGDLAELVPTGLREPGAPGAADPDAVTDSDVAELSAEVIVDLAAAVERARRRADRLQTDLDAALEPVSAVELAKRAVVRLGEETPVIGWPLRGWRRLRALLTRRGASSP